MCDYSLHGIKNRLANEGEQLFIHKFHTSSKGLASVADLRAACRPTPAPPGTSLFGRLRHWGRELIRLSMENPKSNLPAVCVPPGARLRLSGISMSSQAVFGVGETEDVVFVQMTAEPFRYRDAVRFGDGREVLLQRLNEGIIAEVLAVAVEEERELVTPALVKRAYAHV